MQYSELPIVGIYFEPIFSRECDISPSDYADLQKYIFSKIPIFSQEKIKPTVSMECRARFVSSVSTTYVFRVTDFKKKDRQSAIDILHYKLPFVSKSLLGNEQHVYEIKIEVSQKTKQLYHLGITVQTETQVRNQKRLRRVARVHQQQLLKEKVQEEKIGRVLASRKKSQSARYVLRKLETPYMVGDLRDWEATGRAAS